MHSVGSHDPAHFLPSLCRLDAGRLFNQPRHILHAPLAQFAQAGDAGLGRRSEPGRQGLSRMVGPSSLHLMPHLDVCVSVYVSVLKCNVRPSTRSCVLCNH